MKDLNYFKNIVKDLFMPLGLDSDQRFLPGGPDELAKLLFDANNENKKLRVKLGIDPTGKDLHLGHTVCLHVLRKFQELGHLPVLIIGGFTAAVGDPSGRNEARPPLTYSEIEDNAKTYLEQVGKILDLGKDKNGNYKSVEILNNFDWLNKLTSKDFIRFASSVTVNQMIAKEAFGNRISNNQPLYLHEILYPILQGYDSVIVRADIEIGGVDQVFNVLFGRHMQKLFNQKEQFVLLNPILVGLDGKLKMSKTFNNYISLNDLPNDVFGKIMSVPDELIMQYFKYVSNESYENLINYKNLLDSQSINPRDIKLELAKSLVTLMFDSHQAEVQKENFIKQFSKNEIPDEIPEYSLNSSLRVVDLMCESGLTPSKGEAKRLIQSGGVKLRSEKITDPNLLITLNDKDSVLQIGKRKFIKIV